MLLFLFAWILFSIFVAEVLPDLVAGIVYVLIKLPGWIWRGLLWTYYATVSFASYAWPIVRDAGLFVFYFASEVLSGASEADEGLDGDEDDGYEPGQEDEREHDSYLEACDRLGLKEPFTPFEFKAAYRRAIAEAHPDRGGTTQQAQAVNEARARILERAAASN